LDAPWWALFAQRILEYSRSLGPFQYLRYELVAILKDSERFVFASAEQIHVDLERQQVTREKVLKDYQFSAPSAYSPVREATGPGSYVAAV